MCEEERDVVNEIDGILLNLHTSDAMKCWRLIEELIQQRIEESKKALGWNLSSEKCPVCSGTGIVPNGFYRRTTNNWSTSSTAPETCRSCRGTGVIYLK